MMKVINFLAIFFHGYSCEMNMHGSDRHGFLCIYKGTDEAMESVSFFFPRKQTQFPAS